MKQWDGVYRELLNGQNSVTEAVAATKTLVVSLLARAETAEAELEAQWRPVTITEPSQNVTVELLIVGYRGDDGYWHYPDGPEGLVIRGWRPLPPAPQEQPQ